MSVKDWLGWNDSTLPLEPYAAKLLSVDDSKSRGGGALITYDIELRVKVTVGYDGSPGYAICGRCQCEPPPPARDLETALYLLRYSDRQRLVFPRTEDEEDERDGYIVRGWTQNGEEWLCPSCSQDYKKFLKGKS